MATKSTKGYRVVQKMEGGKLKITLERLPFYGRNASQRIRERTSKKTRAVHPGLDALFTPAKR